MYIYVLLYSKHLKYPRPLQEMWNKKLFEIVMYFYGADLITIYTDLKANDYKIY